MAARVRGPPRLRRGAWYERELSVPAELAGKRLLLGFDAVDDAAKVWVNGERAGEHAGGQTPFQFDVTDLIQTGKVNTITLRDVGAAASPG